MQSAPNAWDKIKVTDVVVSTYNVTFLANRFPRLTSLPMSAIFVSGTSGTMAILKYRSVNPILSVTASLLNTLELSIPAGFCNIVV